MHPKDIYKITSHRDSKQPLVFKSLLKWNILSWSLEDWSKKFKDEQLTFRKIPFFKSKDPFWENQCEKMTITMAEFINLQRADANENFALYFDYKYMKDYFKDSPEMVNEVVWADLGYNLTGYESTIWIGSRGSNTLCHKDTYGYNLMTQIHGHKSWLLFPPETDLHPTRVPFEESTIFSKLNLFYPNLDALKDIEGARRVVLEPGDVLFLPNGWWHYVENLDTAISVNIWLPMPEIDTKRRIEEGLILVFIESLLKNISETEESNIMEKVFNKPNEYLSGEMASDIFPLLKKAVFELHKIRTDKAKETNTVDFKSILESNSNYVKVVETLSKQQFKHILEEQRTKYDFVDLLPGFSSNKLENNILDSVINSFCKEDNISRVADDFIKNLK